MNLFLKWEKNVGGALNRVLCNDVFLGLVNGYYNSLLEDVNLAALTFNLPDFLTSSTSKDW